LSALALGLAALPATALASPAFTSESSLASDTGHILLEWNAPGPVTLEMARNDSFTDAATLYSGANRAFFLSGLANGDYFLRLRGMDGTVSAPAVLRIEHQSLTQALWLAALGALITLAVIAAIVRGPRDA